MARSLIGGFEYNSFAKHISQYAECRAQSDSLVSRHRMRCHAIACGSQLAC